MATVAELLAADLLAIALERESMSLTNRLFGIFREGGSDLMKQVTIQDILHTEISGSVGKMWAPQLNFIKESLGVADGDPIRVKKMRWPELYERQTSIAMNMLQKQSLAPLVEAGSVLNDLITRQVDDTQEEAGRAEGLKWRRHTDPGACKWCLQQVQDYRDFGFWLRHANCRCFKVRDN